MSDRGWGWLCLAATALLVLDCLVYPWYSRGLEATAFVVLMPAAVMGLWLVGRRA